jgi:hypothetical protein
MYFPEGDHPGVLRPGLRTKWCGPHGRTDAGAAEREESTRAYFHTEWDGMDRSIPELGHARGRGRRGARARTRECHLPRSPRMPISIYARGCPPRRLLKQRERVPSQSASLTRMETWRKAWRGPGWYVPARKASDSQITPLWRTENTHSHLSPPSGPTLPLESQVASTDSNTPPPYQFTKAICRPTA